jgi:hypothetical protein
MASNATSFKPGRKKTGGRKRGVRNKKTTIMMEAVLLAAESIGSDGAGKDGLVGYLTTVARKNVPVFCKLLAQVMVLQEAEPKEKPAEPVVRGKLTLEELKAELKKRGLPTAIFFDPDYRPWRPRHIDEQEAVNETKEQGRQHD